MNPFQKTYCYFLIFLFEYLNDFSVLLECNLFLLIKLMSPLVFCNRSIQKDISIYYGRFFEKINLNGFHFSNKHYLTLDVRYSKCLNLLKRLPFLCFQLLFVLINTQYFNVSFLKNLFLPFHTYGDD